MADAGVENGTPTDVMKRREILPPEDIRTLYVLGLPREVRYREVYNFFRFIPGFEHLSLNISGRSPAAWVIFDSHNGAISALERINGLNFDPEDEALTLRVELAKNNSHARKRTRQEIEADKIHLKRSRSEHNPYGAAAAAAAATYPHHAAYSAHAAAAAARPDAYMAQAAAAYPGYPPALAASGYPAEHYARDPYAAHRVSGQGPNPNVIAGIQHFIQINGHQPAAAPADANPPCSTLFVGSIARETTEEELRHAFAGCNRFKFTPPRDKGGPIVFVDFVDVETAMAVRELLYGFRFRSAMHYDQGIKIEFAKSKMSEPRPGY